MTDDANLANAAVLISGGGSNLQAILDASTNNDIAARVSVVVSNNPNAKGLQRAAGAGIATVCIDHRDFSDRLAFDRAMIDALDAYQPDFLILAGFMRILTPEFVAHYNGRVLNIHPSLLPSYSGLQTHQRAIDNNKARHGCTVHFVTDELDGGPLLIQGSVPVRDDDTAESLGARVLAVEHQIYPIAVDLMARGRVHCNNGTAFLDGVPLASPILHPRNP